MLVFVYGRGVQTVCAVAFVSCPRTWKFSLGLVLMHSLSPHLCFQVPWVSLFGPPRADPEPQSQSRCLFGK